MSLQTTVDQFEADAAQIHKGVSLAEDTHSAAGTYNWDVDAKPVLQLTLEANVTQFNISNGPNNCIPVTLILLQDDTGGRTVANSGDMEAGEDDSLNISNIYTNANAFLVMRGVYLPSGALDGQSSGNGIVVIHKITRHYDIS